jgi:hypothetical protein
MPLDSDEFPHPMGDYKLVTDYLDKVKERAKLNKGGGHVYSMYRHTLACTQHI